MEERLKGAGLDRFREIWNRRKRLVILVFLGSFSAGIGLFLFLPDLYRATATMLIEGQPVPEAFVRSVVTSEIETRIHTITQKILSRSRLEELISRFDLYPELRGRVPFEAVIEQMRKDIRPELKWAEQRGGQRTTVAFTISYHGRDPETVARVTNALASSYIEENVKIRERQAAETAEVLWSQIQELRQRLDTQERRKGVEKQEIPVGASSSPEALVARITELKQELAELRAKFSDKYPDVVRVQAEIAALELQLANEIASEGGRAVQDLVRDHKTIRELYDSLLKRYADARLAENMEQRQQGEQFWILDPAISPEQPVAPNRMRLLILSLMLSFAVAVGVAALVEQLDASFHTVEDLRAFTRVPVLARIPTITTSSDIRWQRRKLYLTAASVLFGLALIVGATYTLAHGNESIVRLLARIRI